jgi:hypothetical protein
MMMVARTRGGPRAARAAPSNVSRANNGRPKRADEEDDDEASLSLSMFDWPWDKNAKQDHTLHG